jgi:hypothetical protein
MSGVTKDGILQTDDVGGSSSTTVAIGQPINANDAAVLNAPAVGTEFALAVRLVGATGGGGPATIADGADVVEGSLADAAVITDTTGTLSGKLRGLVKWAFERMPTSLGQKVMASSLPVVLSSDQSSIPVTGAFFQATQPVSAVNLDIRDLIFAADKVDVSGSTSVGVTGPLTDAQLRASAVPISAAALPLPTGAATEATLATRLAEATFTTRINTLGQKVAASSTPVVLASDQSSIPVTGPLTDTQLRATPVPISGTINTKTDLTPSAPSAVSVGVASALALAANANRKGLKLINTSNAIISLGLGNPAVLNSGITLAPYGVFQMDEYDFDLGAINAIASAAASNLAIQEFTT